MHDLWEQRGASRRPLRARAICWILVTVPLALACSDQRRGTPPAVPVTVARAEQRTVPFEITAPARSSRCAVTGIVTRVRFNEGDDVREGDMLVQIDPRPYRNALQQTQPSPPCRSRSGLAPEPNRGSRWASRWSAGCSCPSW